MSGVPWYAWPMLVAGMLWSLAAAGLGCVGAWWMYLGWQERRRYRAERRRRADWPGPVLGPAESQRLYRDVFGEPPRQPPEPPELDPKDFPRGDW